MLPAHSNSSPAGGGKSHRSDGGMAGLPILDPPVTVHNNITFYYNIMLCRCIYIYPKKNSNLMSLFIRALGHRRPQR